MKTLDPTVQTLYQDLVQQVHVPREQFGSVYVRRVKGTEYAYLKNPVGTVRRDIFLGRTDDDATQRRVNAIQLESRRARSRRWIVRALKSAGIPSPSDALGAVLDACADAGLHRHAVLVGTAAYQCYSAIIGVTLPGSSMMTKDADLATASLAISGIEASDTMEIILRRADPTFAAVPGLDPQSLPSHFRSDNGFVVDLLTPQLRRTDPNPLPLKNLQAGATPLQHLRWLIDTPIPAVALFGSGVPVAVPAPARFAIHKLIVAQKRTHDRPKRGKDLRQAHALIEALQTADPWALVDAYESACAEGAQGWKTPITRSLRELQIDPARLALPPS
ncbi:GSU2403 family nucleotidyltransferase fold protein [Mesorhizobium sp. KR9-304]|uniref:GSU2403 family nucleotidyltransferase fold protein n=1 Tax=Mesorhizobium sp. KR9-304 TaxID=3156614 RepID=UPI0032B43640